MPWILTLTISTCELTFSMDNEISFMLTLVGNLLEVALALHLPCM